MNKQLLLVSDICTLTNSLPV